MSRPFHFTFIRCFSCARLRAARPQRQPRLPASIFLLRRQYLLYRFHGSQMIRSGFVLKLGCMGLDRRLLIKKVRNPNVHRAPPRAYYCRADNPRDSLCLGVFDATGRVQATSEEELPYPDPDHPCVSVCCEPRRASVSVAWTLRPRRRSGDELMGCVIAQRLGGEPLWRVSCNLRLITSPAEAHETRRLPGTAHRLAALWSGCKRIECHG